jgi:hypothetical protein
MHSMRYKKEYADAECNFSIKEAGLTDFDGVVWTVWDQQPRLMPRL